MIALKKIWIAFSIVALSAFVVVPAAVSAQAQTGGTQYQTGGTQYQTGGSQYQNGGTQYQNGGTNYQGGGTQYQTGGTQFQTGGTQYQTGGANSGPGGLNNPLGDVTGLCQLLKIVLNVLILIGIPIAMFFLVYAGFKLVFARGRPTELDAAKKNLLNTIIGIAIFLGVWFIVQVIANTLGALGVQILGDCH